MKRVKSTPQDEAILRDETANPADRASAATRLASDGFGKEIFPVLDNWLSHSSFILRDEAVSILLGVWGHEKYVGRIIEMLNNDSHWLIRKSASQSLATFIEKFAEGEKYKAQVIEELLKSLLDDEKDFVQKKSYEGLYKLIKNERPREDNDSFDRNQDVDWILLQPYLEKYALNKPN